MNRKTILTQKQSVALIRHLSVGGVTALLLVLLFLAGAGESDLNWASLWWIRPIVIVTLAGAMGGSWFYFMCHHMISNKLPRIIVGALGYIILIWMGTVLGFVGTLWN
jgi:hypothetical protein